jgi:hypothetical protein
VYPSTISQVVEILHICAWILSTSDDLLVFQQSQLTLTLISLPSYTPAAATVSQQERRTSCSETVYVPSSDGDLMVSGVNCSEANIFASPLLLSADSNYKIGVRSYFRAIHRSPANGNSEPTLRRNDCLFGPCQRKPAPCGNVTCVCDERPKAYARVVAAQANHPETMLRNMRSSRLFYDKCYFWLLIVRVSVFVADF